MNTSEVHGSLLASLAQRACEMPHDFKPQELCNLLWAFATLKVRHAKLFEGFAEAATRQMHSFTPQGLSQTMWAYSKLNLSKHALLLSAAQSAIPKLPTYDVQSLGTLAWAFANLEVEHRPLLSAICTEASKRLQFTPSLRILPWLTPSSSLRPLSHIRTRLRRVMHPRIKPACGAVLSRCPTLALSCVFARTLPF